MILKARRGKTPSDLVRYLQKNDRSDSVSWYGFDGTYKTLRRDFSRAIDDMYSRKVTPRTVAPLHTIIISFHADELNPKKPEDVEAAKLLAQSWTMEMYPDRPSLFAVQSDGRGGCLHVHIAVSNVGSDGRCLDKSLSDYRRLTRSFTEHMRGFGMEDILHDEKGNQTYQRSPEDKASRFTDVHEKARREGLNSWKDCLSIRLDSVLLEKPATQEDFERECEKAGVLIRQPRGKGNKSWTSLKNWSFGLAEMNSEAGMEDLRKTWILTDPRTKLHYCTDRGLGGSGKYTKEGISEALGWVEKPAERAEKTVEPKPVERAEKPKEKVISKRPRTLDELIAEQESTSKEGKGKTMRAKDDFDVDKMHRETVESIYNTTRMLMSMNRMTFDEALEQATKTLPDYRGDVRDLYRKEHPEVKTAAKPAVKQRSEQRSKKSKQQQSQQPTQYKQHQKQQTPQKQKDERQLSPQELEYEMARNDAMNVLRHNESSLMVVLFAWWNLMAAERKLIQHMEQATDAEMEAMRAEDEAEYQEVEKLGSNRVALERLAKRTMRDLNKGYREGRRFLKRITQQGDIHLTPEQQKISDAYHARQAILRQQSRGEMEL